jgi:hypothetical protein
MGRTGCPPSARREMPFARARPKRVADQPPQPAPQSTKAGAGAGGRTLSQPSIVPRKTLPSSRFRPGQLTYEGLRDVAEGAARFAADPLTRERFIPGLLSPTAIPSPIVSLGTVPSPHSLRPENATRARSGPDPALAGLTELPSGPNHLR